MRSAAIAFERDNQRAIPFCSARSTLSPRSKFIRSADLHPVEERIGYKFRNPLLLAEAFTHPSLGHEPQQRHFDNEGLEFLGDAILQHVRSEYLFGHFVDRQDEQRTPLRPQLVS